MGCQRWQGQRRSPGMGRGILTNQDLLYNSNKRASFCQGQTAKQVKRTMKIPAIKYSIETLTLTCRPPGYGRIHILYACVRGWGFEPGPLEMIAVSVNGLPRGKRNDIETIDGASLSTNIQHCFLAQCSMRCIHARNVARANIFGKHGTNLNIALARVLASAKLKNLKKNKNIRAFSKEAALHDTGQAFAPATLFASSGFCGAATAQPPTASWFLLRAATPPRDHGETGRSVVKKCF